MRSLNTYGREKSLKKECKFVTKKQLPSIANKLMIGSSLYVRNVNFQCFLTLYQSLSLFLIGIWLPDEEFHDLVIGSRACFKGFLDILPLHLPLLFQQLIKFFDSSIVFVLCQIYRILSLFDFLLQGNRSSCTCHDYAPPTCFDVAPLALM